MGDYDRVASLFTPDGVVRTPNFPVELAGVERIHGWRERREALADYFVQATHPGTIQLDGDTASGRMRSQVNLIRAAADPRSRRSLGDQI